MKLPHRLILTAERLERAGRSPIQAEELVVAAWQDAPELFGLKGHPYPDSNRVLTGLMGKKGLRNRGWFDRKGEKLYALSAAGRKLAAEIRHDEADAFNLPRRRMPVPERIAVEVARLLTAVAYHRFEQAFSVK